MKLQINLFVHGVPRGHKVWGPKEADAQYFGSFYGPKWDLDEVMKVDIMNFGGTTYAYYTFVKGLNVCDSDGRAGSYFALTLRFNAYYADVQNVYHILRAAYEKMCVGLCINSNNNHLQYTHADFSNIDAQLKDIEKEIIGYIKQFSILSDITSLAEFVSNTQNAAATFNLHECTAMAAYEAIKRGGKLITSPLYMAQAPARTVESYKEMMETTKREAQKVIAQERQDAQVRIAATNKKMEESIADINRQKAQEIEQCRQDAAAREQAIRDKYATIDQEIESLKQTISEKDKQLRQQSKDIDSLNDKTAKLAKETEDLKMKLERKIDVGTTEVKKPIKGQHKSYLKIGILITTLALLILSALICGYFLLSQEKEQYQDVTDQQEVEESQTETEDSYEIQKATDREDEEGDDTQAPVNEKEDVDGNAQNGQSYQGLPTGSNQVNEE